MTYSKTALADAKANITHIKTAIENATYRLDTAVDSLPDDAIREKQWKENILRFTEAMDDDFQTQNGITIVYEMIRDLNKMLEQAEVSRKILERMLKDLTEILAIFGIEDLQSEEDLLDEEIERLIQQREQARAVKDFEQADHIRDLLKDQGIRLEDTPQGIRWKREEK